MVCVLVQQNLGCSKAEICFLAEFNFARFHFLRPLVIYVSFALALYLIWRMGKGWKWLVYAAVAAQLMVLAPFNEEYTYGVHYNAPTFKEFYASEQFKEIKEYIGRPQDSYRVASIGLHPSIALVCSGTA